MSNQTILNAAYKAWKQSGCKVLFAIFLEAEKSAGRFWSA